MELGALPLHLRPETIPDLVVVHASLRNDLDTVRPYTPEAELEVMFPNLEEHNVLRGHNHYGQTRHWDGHQITTIGSIGLSMDGLTTAQYLLLDRVDDDWHVQHQSIPYDLDAAIARFHDTGYLRETGSMGRLFLRELVTATQQWVPFLHHLKRWRAEGDIGLDQALERFLNEY